MRYEFFVLRDPLSDRDRFAILWRDTIPIGAHLWSVEDMQRVFQAHFKTLTFVSEEQIRGQLADMGLPHDDIEDQIDRARKLRTSHEQTTWERTTQAGYRNQYAQEVIRKTAVAGTLPDQRVYVLQCGHCGHAYGANGCDIHVRQCPACQGGPPGLPPDIA